MKLQQDSPVDLAAAELIVRGQPLFEQAHLVYPGKVTLGAMGHLPATVALALLAVEEVQVKRVVVIQLPATEVTVMLYPG